MLSICMHAIARSQLLSALFDGHVNNVQLQTTRHQQGAALAH